MPSEIEILNNGKPVLIDDDMSVMPRCGSCLEPLFTAERWEAIVRNSEDAVSVDLTPLNEVLASLGLILGRSRERHQCHCYVIPEYP